MPRLLLIRHAQAANAPLDRDRPLTEDGARHAAAIGEWLADTDLVPERVLVSPAMRARETWERATAALGAHPGPTVDDRIYDNTVEDLLAVLREVADDVATVALVGHNPSIGALAAELDDDQGDPAVREKLDRGFGAGGVAVFDIAAGFAGIGPGVGTLTHFRVP